jgi:hypothetical protein
MVVVFKYDSGLLPQYSSVTMDATAPDGAPTRRIKTNFQKNSHCPPCLGDALRRKSIILITELGSEPNRFISVITELKIAISTIFVKTWTGQPWEGDHPFSGQPMQARFHRQILVHLPGVQGQCHHWDGSPDTPRGDLPRVLSICR